MPPSTKAQKLAKKVDSSEKFSDELKYGDLTDSDIELLRHKIKCRLAEPAPKPAKDPGPGPGQYRTLTTSKSSPRTPRFVPPLFETSPKEDIVYHTPGPGQYPQHSPKTKSALLLGREKPSLLHTDVFENPGPGRYEIKGVIGNDGPKFRCGTRLYYDEHVKSAEMGTKPGPGAYDTVPVCSDFSSKVPNKMDPLWMPTSKKKTLKPLPVPEPTTFQLMATSRRQRKMLDWRCRSCVLRLVGCCCFVLMNVRNDVHTPCAVFQVSKLQSDSRWCSPTMSFSLHLLSFTV